MRRARRTTTSQERLGVGLVMLRDATRENGGKGSAQPEIRILVLELDDGTARHALEAADDLLLTFADSFEHIKEPLRENRPDAIVVALGALRPSDAVALKELVN